MKTLTNQDDLLRVPEGNRTDAGLRQNISIGIQYIEAWLRVLVVCRFTT